MIAPGLALGIFAALLAIGAALFWPRHGLFWRALRLWGLSERVRLEDALKHLLNSELAGRRASLESLAGALEVSRGRASRVAERLEQLELAEAASADVRLTQQGRSYALRVLRTHRLWERYLADRTGVSPSEWHPRAEEQEHLLGAEETEALSATLGHPLVDPHGDPIPTSAGELPAALGVALPSLEPGESGRVVHVEDEPAEAWARIEATGLAPGAVITRLPGQGARVRFRLGAAVHELDALVAAGVTVEPAEAEPVLATGVTMADLQPGESARVVALDAACQGPQRRRLLDLGVVPGTQIAAEFAAASGEPVAYRIRGALIALRRRQAAWVHVERVVAGAGGEGAGSGADRVTTGASG